jgi:hypothetical protein
MEEIMKKIFIICMVLFDICLYVGADTNVTVYTCRSGAVSAINVTTELTAAQKAAALASIIDPGGQILLFGNYSF